MKSKAGFRHSGCSWPWPCISDGPSCWWQLLQYLLPSLSPRLLASLVWRLLVITHWHMHPYPTFIFQFPQSLCPCASFSSWHHSDPSHTPVSSCYHCERWGPLGSWSLPDGCHFYLRTHTCIQNTEPLTQEITQRWNLIGKQDMFWWSGWTSVLITHCWYSTWPCYPLAHPFPHLCFSPVHLDLI